MQQLFFVRKETMEWREVPAPVIKNGHEALVRPFAVAKCDLDDAFLFQNLSGKLKLGSALGLVDPSVARVFKNMFKGPFPFGHECVAEVMEVGDQVTHIKVGDVVAVPFQISCGHCVHCTSGLTSVCTRVPAVATYGFGMHLSYGGAMSDLLNVPYADAMLLPIPPHIDPVHLASLGDNAADAYRTVGPYLEPNPDQRVLIIGGYAKSVGLYAVAMATALGAAHISYADQDPERLEQAHRLGAHELHSSLKAVQSMYDLVVEASSTEQGLHAAMAAVKPGGNCISVGIYMKKTRMPLVDMYAKGVTFKTGLANARPDAEKVLQLISSGRLDLSAVTTKLESWDHSIDAFLSKSSKVIVTRARLSEKKE